MVAADHGTPRSLHFSLRAVLVFVAIVALALGSGSHYVRRLQLKQDTVDQIRVHGHLSDPDYHNYHFGPMREPPGPRWLRHLAGPDVFIDFTAVSYADSYVSDADLVHLPKIPTLEYVDLKYTDVTDVGLEHLAKIPTLQEIDLTDTDVTDVGLKHLNGLNHLEFLWLEGTKVTSSGVEELSRSITNCQIVCDFALYRAGVIEQ